MCQTVKDYVAEKVRQIEICNQTIFKNLYKTPCWTLKFHTEFP